MYGPNLPLKKNVWTKFGWQTFFNSQNIFEKRKRKSQNRTHIFILVYNPLALKITHKINTVNKLIFLKTTSMRCFD
jgi:hypothetical protein